MKPILLFLLFISCISVHAQPGYYEWRIGSHTYANLSGDVKMSHVFEKDTTYMIPLSGETFTFYGKTYPMDGVKKTVGFTNAGNIRIDDDSTFIIVDAALQYLDSIDANSGMSYKLEGSGNNKILKMQWKNMKIRTGAADNFCNFQVWVYQANGILEIHYGPSKSNETGYTSQTGPHIGFFYAPDAFNKMYEKIWLTKGPGTYTLDTNATIAFWPAYGLPAENTVFRFVPRNITADINDITGKKVSIYPNPVHDKLMVDAGTGSKVHVTLTDVSGKVMTDSDYAGNDIEIDTKGLASGIYSINIQGNNIHYTQSVVIQH